MLQVVFILIYWCDWDGSNIKWITVSYEFEPHQIFEIKEVQIILIGQNRFVAVVYTDMYTPLLDL